LKLETINADDGVDKLITYLDKLFRKDELSEVYERYILFDRFERSSQQPMDDFILEFEKRYNRIMQKEMKLHLFWHSSYLMHPRCRYVFR